MNDVIDNETIEPCGQCGSTDVTEWEPMWVRYDWTLLDGHVEVVTAHEKQHMDGHDSDWRCAQCNAERSGPVEKEVAA